MFYNRTEMVTPLTQNQQTIEVLESRTNRRGRSDFLADFALLLTHPNQCAPYDCAGISVFYPLFFMVSKSPWFPHDMDSRNSQKLRMLRKSFGSNGYAWYFM